MITPSLIVSCLIFLLIAIRQWLPARVRIWHIMSAGAVLLLVMGQISPQAAFGAIDWNVIGYLFGVFVIAAALYDSGISHHLGHRVAMLRPRALAPVAFVAAVAVCAAVLTNDAAAVIGTPIALLLARLQHDPPIRWLLLLCATVTVGSMISPVGNPQNILIASRGAVAHPVLTFVSWLAVPTLVSLLFVLAWSWWLTRGVAPGPEAEQPSPRTRHPEVRRWPSWLGAALLVALIAVKVLFESRGPASPLLSFGAVGLAAAVPVLLLGSRPLRLLQTIDWQTLVFFIAMFIVTGALLRSGSLQAILGALQNRLSDPPIVAAISFGASQLFSNVPVVDIYLQLLGQSDPATLMTLAGMSTLAGNLFIISAASNVIVVQQAERFGQTAFTFWQFTRWMLPVTVTSVVITYGWLALIHG